MKKGAKANDTNDTAVTVKETKQVQQKNTQTVSVYDRPQLLYILNIIENIFTQRTF